MKAPVLARLTDSDKETIRQVCISNPRLYRHELINECLRRLEGRCNPHEVVVYIDAAKIKWLCKGILPS